MCTIDRLGLALVMMCCLAGCQKDLIGFGGGADFFCEDNKCVPEGATANMNIYGTVADANGPVSRVRVTALSSQENSLASDFSDTAGVYGLRSRIPAAECEAGVAMEFVHPDGRIAQHRPGRGCVKEVNFHFDTPN
jgi:hypothetical protein